MYIFTELSLIVVITTGVAIIMRIFKQPLVVGYIVSGIALGPYVLGVLHSTEFIELFAKIGISILLFIVGLSLSPTVVKETGKVSLIIGMGQVLLTATLGFFLMRALGFENIHSLYGAMALTFSSTIIVLKLLSDKGDINKLYSKIAIGLLIVQDLIATVALLAISAIGSGVIEGSNLFGTITLLLGKGIVAGIILYLISKYVLPKLSAYLATSQELLFLFSIAWGLGMASLFYFIGFSIEIGALIAGVTLSVSSYSYEIGSRMRPLRDFFVVMFFVLLGSQMILTDLPTIILPAIALTAFVLIGKPLIVVLVMNLLGYRTRTGFMTGSAVSQISEFSLILMTLGLALGQVDQRLASLVTLVAVLTIAGSTYVSLYSRTVYAKTKNLLKLLEWRRHFKREPRGSDNGPEMVIFGYDRVGYDFVHVAQKLGMQYTVVDFNPVSIKKLQASDIPFRFGDAEDVEFLQEIGVAGARIIVSTIPDFKVNKMLVSYYRRFNPEGIIMVISHDIKQAKELYLQGATYVIMPHYLGAHHASNMIAEFAFDIEKFDKERNRHLHHIAKREQMVG
ncbi:MAG: hypothetical protein RJB39_548 [Candidatus Parcubacteria bacterium]|jgi:Kef-type K+ transport system membrane component KefB/Trk K+ transport system NAD-binding subunit